MFKGVVSAVRSKPHQKIAVMPARGSGLRPPTLRPPFMRAYQSDSHLDVERLRVQQRLLSPADSEALAWGLLTGGVPGFSSRTGVADYMDFKQQRLDQLRTALAQAAQAPAPGKAGPLQAFEEGVRLVCEAMKIRPVPVETGGVPATDTLVAYCYDMLVVSQATLDRLSEPAMLAKVMRDVVEWALVHQLFGATAATLRMAELGKERRELLQSWMDALYLRTAPPATGPTAAAIARKVLQGESCQLKVSPGKDGWVRVRPPGADGHDSHAASSIATLPCNANRLRAALAAGGIDGDAAIPCASIAHFWQCVPDAMGPQARHLFDHFNRGLPPPVTPAECQLRLGTFTNWLKDLAAQGGAG